MRAKALQRSPSKPGTIPFKPPPGDLTWIGCSYCPKSLSLHQPDEQSPDRLIGICESCRRWFQIQLAPDVSAAVIALLPELDPSQGVTRKARQSGGDDGVEP